ncbi:hypothetical protein GCM10010402_20240 [Actinomadura luteofluorescens]|nr:hypothetical protein [Actinomadura glauciflava]
MVATAASKHVYRLHDMALATALTLTETELPRNRSSTVIGMKRFVDGTVAQLCE